MPSRDPKQTSTQGVVLWLGTGSLGVALLLGMYYMAGTDGRTDLLAWISGLVSLLGAGGAVGAMVAARKSNNVAHDIKRTVGVIDARTNGALDQRLVDAVTAGLIAQGIGVDAAARIAAAAKPNELEIEPGTD